MKKFHQREWLGIEFSTFAQLSSTRLADAGFYEAFYRAFFQRYRGWDDLDPQWRREKQALARFLFGRLGRGESVLSLGCGLGWMEHCLLEMAGGDLHLEVTEVAPAALTWIRRELPQDRVHVGFFPQCLPPGRKFDMIYLCAVDYCLDTPSLVGLLREVASRLTPGGRCLLVSASFEASSTWWPWAVRAAKGLAAVMLEAARLYHRGQLWGWLRTQADYRRAFVQAGYGELRDGFAGGDADRKDYWLEGRPG